MRSLLSLLLFSLCVNACKTSAPAASSTEPVLGQATPMSCLAEAQVLSIQPAPKDGSEEPCSTHPCLALVKILSLTGCGSSFTMPLKDGDTVSVRFAFTLDDTSPVFPLLKPVYPGLKPGDIFLARLEQRLRPGTQGELRVYGYRRR